MPCDVFGRTKKPRHAVLHHLGQSADARRHHRHAARHGFERGKAEAFLRTTAAGTDRTPTAAAPPDPARREPPRRTPGPDRAPCASPGSARGLPRRRSAWRGPSHARARKMSTTASTRLTGLKFERWMISLSYRSGGHSRARNSGRSRFLCTSHSRKFGITRMSRLSGSA